MHSSRTLALCLVGALSLAGRADEPTDLSKFQILDAVEDTHPDGSKTRLYKIAPPPPKPTPLATPPPKLTEAERTALIAEAQAKSGQNFAIGATVYHVPAARQGGMAFLPSQPFTAATLLRWQHEGERFTAWSRIDFNHLRSVGQLIDTEGRHHSFFLMIGTHHEADPEVIVPPELATTPDGFVLIEGDPANTAALHGLRLLHQHYTANTTALIQRAQQRELREEAARNAPKPPKKDTVIIYTNIQSVNKGGQK